ncbi:hypothetical protein ACNF40_08475 [Cuniculiplasma sp. SKW4]|uniref:hypothetical protein n=1 Tax=Cuniculiplasma sp. SKW4 TaxID=3400171 RepID=UPI003FD25941
MAWTKQQKIERERILSTGFFIWKRKNIYELKDIQGFLESPEKFNEKLKQFYLSIGNVPIGGSGLLSIKINGSYIEITRNIKNMRLFMKYKDNLGNWFRHDHYILSDGYFDDIEYRIKKGNSCGKMEITEGGE